MLITFFGVRDIVYSVILLKVRTINHQLNKEILRHMVRSVCEKRRELCREKIVGALSRQCICSLVPEHPTDPAERNLTVLQQTPYSLDFPACDFYLSSKLKGKIIETRFEGRKAIKRIITTEQMCIPEESSQQCIEAWQRRIEKCIRFNGGLF